MIADLAHFITRIYEATGGVLRRAANSLAERDRTLIWKL